MEFDELQKIWDMQKNEAIYVINETALHNRILSKKRSAAHIANFSELLLIFVNIGTGLLVSGTAVYKSSATIFTWLLTGWMMITTLYVVVNRIRRKKGEIRFDRSMLGDLKHAISNATHQVRLSGIMLWNSLPLGLLFLLAFWESGKLSAWIVIFLAIFLVLVYYASRWEHGIYKRRKRELEVLQQKLENEEASSPLSR
jgi:hypothetical protein